MEQEAAFPVLVQDLLPKLAQEVLEAARDTEMAICTAESCTGGMVASLLTDVEGLSTWFRSGFVVYSDEAKTALLGIPARDVQEHGAVSREIARAMARCALRRSGSDVAIAVSGYTGAAGSHENGLVHVAVADAAGHDRHREHHFGDVVRTEGRALASAAALRLLLEAIDDRAQRRF